MSGQRRYKIARYGEELRANKARVLRACESRGIAPERRALILAMAMIETNHLSPRERDAQKDKYTDGSANASIFNLSEDLLRTLGYRGDIHKLDSLDSLPIVTGLINKGFDSLGVSRMLDFVRGGQTALDDGVSYGAAGYRDALATILKVIDTSPALLTDDRRIEIDVEYQDHLKYPNRR